MQRQPLTQATQHLTTIDVTALRPQERFSFWHDVICSHFSPSENSTDEPYENFKARMSYRGMGPISLSHIHSSPTISTRDHNSLRAKPLDCFFVACLNQGDAILRQGGREARQHAGDFVMYDSSAPFEFINPTEFNGYWMRLPRSIVANRMNQPENMTARVISGKASIGKMVTSLITEAHGIDLKGETPAANRLASSIVDLLAAAFETQAGLTDHDNLRHLSMLERAKSLILSNIENPDLDCDFLVRELGVSRRTLNRLFAQEGATPIKWVWSQRLKRAHEMLASRRDLRVADVALACGFSNFSHFTRSFKAEFGITPKAMLVH